MRDVAAGLLALLVLFSMLAYQRRQTNNSRDPPVVRHWIPIIGSAVAYGADPFKFFAQCQAKYGDVFTFVLFGHKITVCLGPAGNELILHGKLADVSARDVMSNLMTPIFGSGITYDCSDAKFAAQKKFLKNGLDVDALRLYVPLIEQVVLRCVQGSADLDESGGCIRVAKMMGEIVILSAVSCLQGKEAYATFDDNTKALYHDLEGGMAPINFVLPHLPLPCNRRRDRAQKRLASMYMRIIKARRERYLRKGWCSRDRDDLLFHLMHSRYQDGTSLPDQEIAHYMIAMAVGGQHSASATASWAMLRLASEPAIVDSLYREQSQVTGGFSRPLCFEDIVKLGLLKNVVKETLRVHPPLHSLLRKTRNPIPITDTGWLIPKGRVLLSSPAYFSKTGNFYDHPDQWNPYRWNITDSQNGADANAKAPASAKSHFLPFGAGRHRCLGEEFSYEQLMIILATMIRMFQVRNPLGRKGVPETDYASLSSLPTEPAEVILERRSPKAKG